MKDFDWDTNCPVDSNVVIEGAPYGFSNDFVLDPDLPGEFYMENNKNMRLYWKGCKWVLQERYDSPEKCDDSDRPKSCELNNELAMNVLWANVAPDYCPTLPFQYASQYCSTPDEAAEGFETHLCSSTAARGGCTAEVGFRPLMMHLCPRSCENHHCHPNEDNDAAAGLFAALIGLNATNCVELFSLRPYDYVVQSVCAATYQSSVKGRRLAEFENDKVVHMSSFGAFRGSALEKSNYRRLTPEFPWLDVLSSSCPTFGAPESCPDPGSFFKITNYSTL